jgi:hypothetical protein
MSKIIFKPEHHQPICHLLEMVNKSDTEARISFVIDEMTCKIIGGMGDNLQIISLETEKKWGIKSGDWSISASSLKQYWNNQKELIKSKTDFYIEVNYKKKSTYPFVDTLTEHESRLYFQSKAAIAKHVEFLSLAEQSKQHTLSTSKAKDIIKAAETHTPFDTFEINKERAQIRIERDNEIIPYALPESLKPEFNLLLNKDSVSQLSNLCDSTSAETVSIYIDDERAIFSDGSRVISSSLLSLRDYANKKEMSFTVEQKLVVNIYTFKKEIENYRDIALIKQANEALLYIDNHCVMFAGLTDETGGNRFLSAEHIGQTRPTVYRIDLSELSKVKVKDITTATQIKIQMLLGNDGKRKLGFYSDRDANQPYQSVYDIELAPEKMNQVLDAKKALEKKIKENGGEKEKQGDLLGFDDV